MTCSVTRGAACRKLYWSVCVWVLLAATSIAQDFQTDEKIRAAIASGEFSSAKHQIERIPSPREADHWLRQIADAQMQNGAPQAALQSLRSITSESDRYEAMQSWNTPRGDQRSGSGGITEADFQELIRLIRRTVDPDSWNDVGGEGAIEPFPAGVYIDQHGALQRANRDTSGRLESIRKRALLKSNGMLTGTSQQRFISLVRLERECQLHAARGEPLPAMLTNLAGLYRIDYLVVDRDGRDLILAGPAGPWLRDADGRALNEATGLPVLQLDDLVACLRNARFQSGKFGCSIEPRQANLAATQQFAANTRARGSALRDQLAKELGMQDVIVFGLPADSHAAHALVEADYLMKLIAVGREPSIPEVPNFLDRMQSGGGQGALEIARWWFTADLDRLVTDEERTVFQFLGTGVKLCSETEFLARDGRRQHTGQANSATEGFASDFTQHFAAMAKLYPAFSHLRGVFDLALVSSLIEQHGLGKQIGWQARFFIGAPDADSHSTRYSMRQGPVPQEVASIVTQRTYTVRPGERETVTAVSGGVFADFGGLVRKAEMVTDESAGAGLQASYHAPPQASPEWWWD